MFGGDRTYSTRNLQWETETAQADIAGHADDVKQLRDDQARAQQARITAEAALSSSRAAAEAEANTLRQQLLQALQKACDAELRASNLQLDKDSSAAQQQV